jgi:hypothetical protein
VEWEDEKGSGRDLFKVEYYFIIHLEGLRKTTTNLNQDNRYLGRDSAWTFGIQSRNANHSTA